MLDVLLHQLNLRNEVDLIVVQVICNVSVCLLDSGFDLQKHCKRWCIFDLFLLFKAFENVLTRLVNFFVGLGRDGLAGLIKRFGLQILKLLHGIIGSCLHFTLTILKVAELGLSLLLLSSEFSLFLFDLLFVLLTLLNQEQVFFLQIFKDAHKVICILKRHFKLVV